MIYILNTEYMARMIFIYFEVFFPQVAGVIALYLHPWCPFHKCVELLVYLDARLFASCLTILPAQNNIRFEGFWGLQWHTGVSKNSGTPKSCILIRFSLINHPFWGTPIFGNTHTNTFEIYHGNLKEFPNQH